MARKVSPHLMNAPSINDIRPLLEEWQPTVIKSIGHPGYLLDVMNVAPAGTKFVQRYWWDDPTYGDSNNFSRMANLNPSDAYRAWQTLVDLPPLARKSNVYVESFNEAGVSDEYMRFEAARCRFLWRDYGLRSCVLNCAIGHTNADVWRRANETGLLAAVRDTGSVIGVHNYAGLFMNFGHADAVPPPGKSELAHPPAHYVQNRMVHSPDMLGTWQAFRVARDHAHIRDLGYGDVKFILTEFGLDNVDFRVYKAYTGGQEAGAWRTLITHWQNNNMLNGLSAEEFYAHELEYAERQLQAYPFVIGATVFTVGSQPGSLWDKFDIYPSVIRELLNIWKSEDSGSESIPPTESDSLQVVLRFGSGEELVLDGNTSEQSLANIQFKLDNNQSFMLTSGNRQIIFLSTGVEEIELD